MSLPWFREYSEDVRKPPLATMAPSDFKAWIQLKGIANEEEDRGLLPAASAIAYMLRISEAKAVQLLHRFQELGLVARDEESRRMAIVNRKRYFPKGDDANQRMKRHRNALRNDARTSSESVRNLFDVEEEERGREIEEEKNVPFGHSDTEEEGEGEGEVFAIARRRLRESGIAGENTDDLRSMLDESGLDCVLHCVDESVRYNKLSLAYVDVVRRRHLEDGCDLPGDTRRDRLIARSEARSRGEGRA